MNKLNLDLAKQEAARCLLCYDPPCSKACPVNINPGKTIRSLRFDNLTGAQKIFSKNNPDDKRCSELCSQNKYCEKACIRSKLDGAVKIENLQQFILDCKS